LFFGYVCILLFCFVGDARSRIALTERPVPAEHLPSLPYRKKFRETTEMVEESSAGLRASQHGWAFRWRAQTKLARGPCSWPLEIADKAIPHG
jgi:hypothetical protein